MMDYVIELTLVSGLVWLWLHQRYVHKEMAKDIERAGIPKPASPAVVHQVTSQVQVGRNP